MRRYSLALLACAVVSLAPLPAFGWGATGHRFIGETAIAALPDEVPAFLRTPEVAREVGELAREPDRWKGAGTAHDAERDPAHYIDVSDDLTVAGGPQLAALPPTRADFDSALRKIGTSQYKTGYLPYAIIDGWQQLRIDLAYWRADVAGEKFAHDEAARDWFAHDRALHEQLAIRDLGVWAHFVGDASQPLHVSVHYDGWGDYPNPETFSAHRGIHAQFESAFVRDNVAEADIAARVPAVVAICACGIEAETAAYLAATESEVVPFYRLEKGHAFASPTPEGKSFAAARLAAGAERLRDMVVEAWRASALATVGYPPVRIGDIESGAADALPSLKGED
ncbi:MAG: S1/P1 Nuclease [Alphaproteobacteria bacterium]|nr:S1/P1 Nuclease [Alphaproteobacteria bacterium]